MASTSSDEDDFIDKDKSIFNNNICKDLTIIRGKFYLGANYLYYLFLYIL